MLTFLLAPFICRYDIMREDVGTTQPLGMTQKETIVGSDIGSGYVCLAIAEASENAIAYPRTCKSGWRAASRNNRSYHVYEAWSTRQLPSR